ncbi:MAG: hypothetical protein J6N76_09115 [Lachnospiraceae bacterium]|nr:hypothetical protein [Lachnospiraceae bacterium]
MSSEVSATDQSGNIGITNTGDNMTRVYHSRNSFGSGRRSFRANRNRTETAQAEAPQLVSEEGQGDFGTAQETKAEALGTETAEIISEAAVGAANEAAERGSEAMQPSQPVQIVQMAQQIDTMPSEEIPVTRMTAVDTAPSAMPEQAKSEEKDAGGGAVLPEFDTTGIEDADLLQQINAFRTQAQSLQAIIAAKQAKAREEALAREREAAEEAKRQEAALAATAAGSAIDTEGLLSGIDEQLGRLLEVIQDDMDDLEKGITDSVSGSIEQSVKQTAGLKESIEAISKKLDEQDGEGLKESVEKITGAITATKNELTDAMHSENVKVYRNIQDLLKEDNSNEELELSLEVWYRILKQRLSITMTIMIINMGLAVVLILAILGVIG